MVIKRSFYKLVHLSLPATSTLVKYLWTKLLTYPYSRDLWGRLQGQAFSAFANVSHIHLSLMFQIKTGAKQSGTLYGTSPYKGEPPKRVTLQT
jgi:hypothetical protein